MSEGGSGDETAEARDSLHARLGWLDQPGEDVDESAVLRLALTQAVGALGGLGGLAHLVGTNGSLRLAAVSGVPSGVARAWETVDAASDAAPARAVAARTVAWSGYWPAMSSTFQPAGVLSAPLTAPDGSPIGALSVVLARPHTAQDGSGDLRTLAETASARLPQVRRWRSGTAPWWQQSDGQSRMMREVSVGMWRWHLATGVLELDEVTQGLIGLAGLDTRTWDHQISGWMARIHPDDRPGVEAAIQRSFETGGPYAVEYRVLDLDGRISWLELRAAFEHEDGEPVRMVGTAWNVSERRSREAWLVGLLELHPEPVYVMTTEGRVEWANRAGVEAAELQGVQIAGQVLWEAIPQLREQGLPELLARLGAAPSSSATRTVRLERAGGTTAWYLVRAVEVGGLVAVQWTDVTAQTRIEHAAAERSRRLDELNSALIKAVDTADVIEAITGNVLPMVDADGLVVHDLAGPVPRLVGQSGQDDAFLRAMTATAWSGPSGSPESAHPQFFSSEDELASCWPQLSPLVRLGAQRAWAVVPLVVSDQVVGSAMFTWNRPRDFDADDRSLLGTVGVVIAHALRAAAAYDEARSRSEHLQRELLPGPLPEVTGVAAAARYRTSAMDGASVGGHWYDLVPLPGGRALAVVGDVTGGPDETVAMGILRQAVLTVAALDLPVDELLAHVNDVAHRLGDRLGGAAVTATCLMAQYDPTTALCAVASAGHPPPIVLLPGRPPTGLDMPVGEPLGVAQVPTEISQMPLPPGTVLALTAGALLSEGKAGRLASAVARRSERVPVPASGEATGQERWLTALCDDIIGDARGHRAAADVALLTLITGRLPEACVQDWTLPRVPEAAGRARVLIADTLRDWGREDLADAIELIVSELVGNTVRHAVGIGEDAGEDTAGEIRLRVLNLGPSGVTCEVYDGSEATPRVRHPSFEDEFGRGLMLVALSADTWGTRYTSSGKCIWATTTGAPPS